MALLGKIKSLAEEIFPEVVQHRRHLHAHPELSYQEYETAAYVAGALRGMGIEPTEGVAETGVTALIKGKNPGKKTIALRGDMDALPIQEQNDVPYKSTRPGVMHACGHDVHTSSLLGASKILNSLTSEFEGTIKLMKQTIS